MRFRFTEYLLDADRRELSRGVELEPQVFDLLAYLVRNRDRAVGLARAISLSPRSFDTFVRQRAAWIQPKDHAHLLEGLRKTGWQQ